MGPSFSQQTEWRYILKRLCQFLRSIDYLLQEMLQRIVKTSVEHLLNFVSRSFNVAPIFKIEEEPQIVVSRGLRSTTSYSSTSNYSEKYVRKKKLNF